MSDKSPHSVTSVTTLTDADAIRDRLERALPGGLAGVLSLSVDGLPIIRPTSLVDIAAGTLRFAATMDDLAALHGHVRPGEAMLDFSLRQGNEELSFKTTLQKLDLDPSGQVFLLASIPLQLNGVVRRRGFRLAVTAQDAITVRLWRLAKHTLVRDRPLPSSELPCELVEIGTGGMKSIVRARGVAALNFHENDRFRIEITAGERQILLEGCLRHPKSTQRDDEVVVCGFRFVDRDDIESRRAFSILPVILAELQRVMARRRAAA